MKHETWKGIFIASLVIYVLLVFATVGIWMLMNIGGVFLLLLTMGNQAGSMEGISLSEFFSNFIGSPMFWLFVTDLGMMAVSAVAIKVTKKTVKP